MIPNMRLVRRSDSGEYYIHTTKDPKEPIKYYKVVKDSRGDLKFIHTTKEAVENSQSLSEDEKKKMIIDEVNKLFKKGTEEGSS